MNAEKKVRKGEDAVSEGMTEKTVLGTCQLLPEDKIESATTCPLEALQKSVFRGYGAVWVYELILTKKGIVTIRYSTVKELEVNSPMTLTERFGDKTKLEMELYRELGMIRAPNETTADQSRYTDEVGITYSPLKAIRPNVHNVIGKLPGRTQDKRAGKQEFFHLELDLHHSCKELERTHNFTSSSPSLGPQHWPLK
ncbi:hypothetical protein L596_023037 [Steinernema carpocapsae]|uniref:Uncharacterized protein n=1 Tax=Steinernema carpocapsae TaxID=34508 RepID=A0A4U5MCE4_STECR|nr:hypothetical protein L596_023037 [Steinernema carpocapsae]